MRRFLRPETLFFLFAFAALLLIFRERGLNDPGTLWHTRVGQMILADGFMTTDPFTFSFPGKTWIPQQWGGEVLMALLHRLGGFDAMLFAFLAVFAAIFTVVFRRLLAGGMGWPLASTVTAFALVAASFHFYVRPHIFTIVFMVIVSIMIVDYDEKRLSWKQMFWLIPVHIVWTNIHGGMLGGVATLTLAVACWTTTAILKWQLSRSTLKSLSLLTVMVALCALSMFVNPIGFELQKTWLRLIGEQALANYVPEHSPLDPARGGDQAVLGFAGLYLLILLGAGKPKLIWLIPLVWFALSIQSIRNGPLFVVTAAVMLADIWPHTVWFRRLRVGGGLLAVAPTPITRMSLATWSLPMMVIAVGLTLQHFKIPLPLIGSKWARFDQKHVPVELIDSIQAIPPGERIYNDPKLGGFLIWFAPGRPIFMDDRFELSIYDLLEEYVFVTSHYPGGFADWQRKYGYRWALVVPELTPEIYEQLRANGRWMLVKETPCAALFRMK